MHVGIRLHNLRAAPISLASARENSITRCVAAVLTYLALHPLTLESSWGTRLSRVLALVRLNRVDQAPEFSKADLRVHVLKVADRATVDAVKNPVIPMPPQITAEG